MFSSDETAKKCSRRIKIGKASKRLRKAVASNDKGAEDNLEYDHTVMMNEKEYDDNVIDKVWLEGHENPQESEQDLFAGGLKLAPILQQCNDDGDDHVEDGDDGVEDHDDEGDD